MNKKIAIIKPKLNILQLSVIKIFQNANFVDDNKSIFNKSYDLYIQYLNGAIEQLYNKKMIIDKTVVINYVSNFNPVEITFSTDCQFNVLYLKELQSCLLQNGFELKIIL